MRTDRLIAALAMTAVLVAPLPALAGKVTFTASLSGESEPIAGDADGSGTFAAELDTDTGEVCYRYIITKVAKPTLVQIHMGSIGSNGPPVIYLEPATLVCVEADPEVVKSIIATPGNYYINMVNREFPTGAVRGQFSPPLGS